MSPSAFAPSLPWVPMDAAVHWVWFPALSKWARVGLNGKHTFLITGPLTDFLLSNVNPEQWKTNSSRKLWAMNYQIPNKYVNEGNDHPTVLREGVAGHGWLLCFFFQGIWALFLYIALCLRSSTLGSLLIEQWCFVGFFFLHTPCHFSVWCAFVLPVGIKKITGGRISCPPLPLAVMPCAGALPVCLSFLFGTILISPTISV